MKWIYKYNIISIFILYVLFSLILGEKHPFSRFPMYNHFPNWSYVFYLSDENQELIPSLKFNITGGWIGHTFYSICESENIKYGDDVETDEELYLIGKKMLEIIIAKNPEEAEKYKQINVHKVFNTLVNDSIHTSDKIIYAHNLE